jgi:phage-related baseplate assembly protein
MSRFNLIDLSTLTPPDVVETIDFESIKLDILQDLVTRDPSFSALLESDPAVKLVEAFAYREMMLRQRINDAANANMLATALGSDLDNLAALFGVLRMSFTDAQGNVTSETDDRLRLRAQLAPDAFSCAGPGNAYIYFAFSADLRVADASAFSPAPGNVVVTIYSTDNGGAASPDLLAAVSAALNADDVRPLTDVVEVQGAQVQHYLIAATVTLYPGPDASAVTTAITNALTAYTQNVQRLGYGITLAGMYGALDQAGVQNATIQSPVTDVAGDPYKINVCDAVTVTVAPARTE